jgi:hypothetical protein
MYEDHVNCASNETLIKMLKEIYEWRYKPPFTLKENSVIREFLRSRNLSENYLREFETAVVTVACFRFKDIISMIIIDRPREFININN